MINVVIPLRLLNLVPEVQSPPSKQGVDLSSRIIWSSIFVFIYLIMGHISLYGVSLATDPFFLHRLVLGSSKGTLLELGIMPLMTSSLVMQLLEKAKAMNFNIDLNSRGRQVRHKTEKFLGLVVCLIQACAYVFLGNSISQMGLGNAILVVLQLFFASFFVVLFDEVLSKGYGLVNGISLFICANVCMDVMWKAMAPIKPPFGRSDDLLGAIPNFVKTLITYGRDSSGRHRIVQELTRCFYDRGPGMSTLLGLVASALVIVIVAYLHSCRVEIRMQSRQGNRAGPPQTHKIPLLYLNTMPLVIVSAAVSQVFFISLSMYKRAPKHGLVLLFGKWKRMSKERGSPFLPIGGLAHLLQPPPSPIACLKDPIHAILHLVLMCTLCAVAAYTWLQISGMSVKEVTQRLRTQQMTIYGQRDTTLEKELARYIPTAAICGGIAVGAISVFADVFAVYGSGAGLVMAVTTLCQIREVLKPLKVD